MLRYVQCQQHVPAVSPVHLLTPVRSVCVPVSCGIVMCGWQGPILPTIPVLWSLGCGWAQSDQWLSVQGAAGMANTPGSQLVVCTHVLQQLPQHFLLQNKTIIQPLAHLVNIYFSDTHRR